MEQMPFTHTPLFNWIILPLLIFLARVCDVALGTVRIMMISRGKKYLAPLLGFIEILIWLLAVRQVVQNIVNVAGFFAFAGGFAVGNYVGMWIEGKLAVGVQVVRIITRKESHVLIEKLKKKGYGVTVLDARGTTGPVNIIFTIINRTDLPTVIELIEKHNPRAFYSVEDIRSVKEGVFPPRQAFLSPLSPFRRGK